MKKILIDDNGGIFGTFNNVEQVDNGYICDGASYQTVVTGNVRVEEVPDNYKLPASDVIETLPINNITIEDLQKEIEYLKTKINIE